MKWDPQQQKWVDEYPLIAERVNRVRVTRKARTPVQTFVRIAVPVVAAAVLITGGSLLVAGEEETGAPTAPSPAPSPVTTTSPYDEFEVEQGSARAAVRVIATEPDGSKGRPRIEGQLQQASFITGCEFTALEVHVYPTRALAKSAAQGSKQGAAYAKVAYAEPDWNDKFVVVVVDAECDN